MRSGIPNFCAVALALSDLGYVGRFFIFNICLLVFPVDFELKEIEPFVPFLYIVQNE